MAKPILINMPRNDVFDQWRLGEVGGKITWNRHGSPQFSFTSQAMYDKFLKLNERRHEFYAGAAN